MRQCISFFLTYSTFCLLALVRFLSPTMCFVSWFSLDSRGTHTRRFAEASEKLLFALFFLCFVFLLLTVPGLCLEPCVSSRRGFLEDRVSYLRVYKYNRVRFSLSRATTYLRTDYFALWPTFTGEIHAASLRPCARSMNALYEELDIAPRREKASTTIVFKSCKSGTHLSRLNRESICLRACTRTRTHIRDTYAHVHAREWYISFQY